MVDRGNLQRSLSIIELKTDAVNHGYIYESQVITYILAKLTNDSKVKDFWLISNPKIVRYFEDIICKVSYEDNSEHIFFVQIKHSCKIMKLHVDPLPNEEERRYLRIPLEKYKCGYDKIVSLRNNFTTTDVETNQFQLTLQSVKQENYYFCIFTNMSDVNPELHINEKADEKLDNLLNITGKAQKCNNGFGDDYNSFINRLNFFTNQPHSDRIDANILEQLRLKIPLTNAIARNLCGSIMEHLTKDNQCNPVTKKIFIEKCLEQLFCQQVAQYMCTTSPIKKDYYAVWDQIFTTFDCAIIEYNKKELILPLIASYYEYCIHRLANDITEEEYEQLKIPLKQFDWNNCQANCFRPNFAMSKALSRLQIQISERRLSTEYNSNNTSTESKSRKEKVSHITNLVDLLLFMWHEKSLPLVVDQSIMELVQEIIQLKGTSSNSKKFIIIEKNKADNFPEVKAFRNLYDLKTHDSTFSLMMNVELSLQGRKYISLKEIIGENHEICKVISSTDVLLWTSEITENSKAFPCRLGEPHVTLKNYLERTFEDVNGEIKDIREEDIGRGYGEHQHKLTIISNDAGMGKSTVLSPLANKYDPSCFTIVYNLGNCLSDLDKSTEAPIFQKPIDYFFEKINSSDATETNKIIQEIFCHHRKDGRLTMFIDSFDEILPRYGEKVLLIIEKILGEGISIFITCRSEAEHKLIEKFNCSSPKLLRLSKLTDDDIAKYLNTTHTDENILEKILSKIPQDFLKIPLHLHMLSEVYNEMGNDDLSQTELYKKFIEMKIAIFYKIKKIESKNIQVSFGRFERNMMEAHTRAALVRLFTIDKLVELEILTEKEWSDTQSRFKNYEFTLGIISDIDSPTFVHQTFAEYLVSQYFEANRTLINCDSGIGKLYLQVISTSGLKETFRFLNQKSSEEAGSLYKSIINCDLEVTKHIEIGKMDKNWGMYPLHWAAVNCYLLSRNNHIPTETLETLEKILKYTIEKNLYEIDSGDAIFGLTWINYLTGYCDNTKKYDINKKLINYISENNLSKSLREQIENRIDINYVDNDNCNMLHLACRRGDEQVFKYLLTHRNAADFSPIDNEERNFLHHASFGGNIDILNEILTEILTGQKLTINISQTDKYKKNALHHACDGGSYNAVKRLFEVLDDNSKEAKDSQGRHVFHFACAGGSISVVELIRTSFRNFDVKTVDNEELNGLHYACQRGQFEVAKQLLDFKLCVNQKTKKNMTSLHYVSTTDKMDSVKLFHLLIDRGALLNETDCTGMTALHHACRNGNFNIAELLIKKRMDPGHQDGKSMNALHHACTNGHYKLIRFLVEKIGTEDLAVVDSSGMNCLHHACSSGHFLPVKLLLGKGMDSVGDFAGMTPLHHASRKGYENIVDLLLANRVNYNAEDKNSRSPLFYACSGGHLGVVNILLSQPDQVKLTKTDNDLWNVLYHACHGGNIDIIKIFLEKGLDPYKQNIKGKAAFNCVRDPNVEIQQLLEGYRR